MDKEENLFDSIVSFFKKKTSPVPPSTSVVAPLLPVVISPRDPTVFSSSSPLPRHLWLVLASFLDIDDIFLLGSTCSFMHFLTEDNGLWKELYANGKSHIENITPPHTSWKSAWREHCHYTSWKLVKKQIKIIRYKAQPTQAGSHVKATFIGPTAAGKTCLIKMLTNPEYFKSGFCEITQNTPSVTIGASFSNIKLQSPYFPSFNELEHNVTAEIWDTAGQERYTPLYPMYTRGAHVIVFVHDTSRPDSLDSVDHVWKSLGPEERDTKAILLVGLKIDLPRAIPKAKILKFTKERNMAYVEVCTKTKENIELPFLFLAMATSDKYPRKCLTLLR